jgi:serine/threonine protein phosphatase PrpC
VTFAEPGADDPGRLLRVLPQTAHLAAPHELPGLISEHAQALGARDAVAYLVDLQQTVLLPFTGANEAGAAPEEEQAGSLAIDSTLAGRSYQHVEILTQEVDGDTQVWLPLLDGTERLGVLAVRLPGAVTGEALAARSDELKHFAAVAAELVVTKTFYGDTIVRLRRQAEMALAAEIQWSLLPPLTMACRQVVIAAALEPAYGVAGDSVDYAIDPGHCRCAVLDGMGHGIQSAQLVSLAVAAYRNGRRAGRSLTETARQIDAAVSQIYQGEAFATAVLADLDTENGELTWINAGHPEPLLLRDGKLVRPLHVSPALPFGLGDTAGGAPSYTIGREHLQRGDRLLFYTDGVTEARSPEGEFFGVDRLVDLLVRNFAGGLPAPETMRRVVRALLEHQQGRLDDDATLLLLQWQVDDEERLLPQLP